jgi:SH3 domain protein
VGEGAIVKNNVQSLKLLATAFLLLGVSHAANAFDFVSVAEPAILYDANSLQAKKMFVATRYLPLEQVVVLDNWVKVRDSSGKLFWIEKRQLSSKRYVMVTVPLTNARRNPEDSAEIIFKATQQLALEWQGSTGTGWVKVRHADGTMGYVKSADVWGD